MPYEYINLNPTGDPCPMCAPFTGIIFAEKEDGPPLPAHRHCFCVYLLTDKEPTFTGWDWDEAPPDTRRKWIQELARRLRDGEVPPVPKFLEPLLPAAKKYNEEEYHPRKDLSSMPDTDTLLTEERLTLTVGHIQLLESDANDSSRDADSDPRRYTVNFISAGQNKNGWIMPLEVLEKRLSMFHGVPCLLNHADLWAGPDIECWGGTHEDPVLTEAGLNTTLRINDTPAGERLRRIFDAWIADKQAGLPVPEIGLSADLSLRWQPRDNRDQPPVCADILHVWSGDAVLFPAAGGQIERVLNSLSSLQGDPTMPNKKHPDTPDTPDTPIDAVQSQVDAAAPPTPAPAEAAAPEPDPEMAALQSQIASLSDSVAQLSQALSRQTEDDTVEDNGREQAHTLYGGHSGLDDVRLAVEWLAGVPGAPVPAPSLRRLDAVYRLATGDIEWRGVFQADRVHLATANASTLAGLVADAMNKVISKTYDTLATYRWYELIVDVEPNDGTLQDMKWLTFGGIGALPEVPYGSEYHELEVDDTKEVDGFAVYGGYVGVTRKVLRNSDIARFQAIPRALTIASVRQRSAHIAGIFTANSGTGPVLDEDSEALFHADHNNLATTAYSTAAWAAARIECYKQTEAGSDKRMGLWPKFWLGPADLYDTALIDFGYGAGAGGFPGVSTNDVNPYAVGRPGDPRPFPIAVPDFTDANNWAYLADPSVHPVIKMSYANHPAGHSHPAPELFSVTSPLAGLMFTNDVMPIKVRDEYAYGVATYRGIGKRNVA